MLLGVRVSRHSPKIKNNNNPSDFFACCTSYTGKLQGARAPAVKFHKMSRLYISTFWTKENNGNKGCN